MNNRNLYLLRGIPASGKSTWIKENNLEKYCLSSDKIRLLFPQFGNSITQIYDNQVWDLLYDLMEKRMQLGLPIIIDATHYRKSFITAYEPYCEKYGYHIIVVDFINTELVTCFKRNDKRTFDKVPEQVITKMFETIKQNNNEIKKDFRVVEPDNVLRLLNEDIEWYNNPINKDFINYLYKGSKDIDFRDKEELDYQINRIRDNVLDTLPILMIQKDFDQNNKWHYRNLLDHSIEVMLRFIKESRRYNYEYKPEDLIMTLLHDIGKTLVAHIGKDGYTHFYNHGRIGEQFFNEYIRNQLKDCFDEVSLNYIATMIRVHDEDLKMPLKSLCILHIADAKSHNLYIDTDGKIKARIEKAKETLEMLKQGEE